MDAKLKKEIKNTKGLTWKKNSQFIWYRFQANKKSYEKSTGTLVISKALEILHREKEKVKNSRSNIPTRKDGSITLDDVWPAFVAIAPAKMKRVPAAGRWEQKRKLWLNFITYMKSKFNPETIADITTPQILDYVTQIKQHGKWISEEENRPLSPTTQCEYLILVKQVFTFIRDQAGITKDHFKEVALPKVTREGRETFTESELKDISQYLNGVGKDADILGPIFFTGINTGLRRGDICTLKGEHVNLKKREIKKKTNKTGNEVIIPISKNLLKFLEDYPIVKGEPVFKKLFDKYQTSKTTISFMFNNMLDKLKIDNTEEVEGRQRKVSRKDAHSLRHSFCFLHAMKLTPLPVLQSMVGHMSKEQTQHYISHSNEQAKKMAQTIMDDFDFTKGGE